MPNDVSLSILQLEKVLYYLARHHNPLYEELATKWVWARANLVGALFNKVMDNHYLWTGAVGSILGRRSLHYARMHDCFYVTEEWGEPKAYQTWEDALKAFIYGREGQTIEAVRVSTSGTSFSIVFKGTLDSHY